jgi:hypothetical protein
LWEERLRKKALQKLYSAEPPKQFSNIKDCTEFLWKIGIKLHIVKMDTTTNIVSDIQGSRESWLYLNRAVWKIRHWRRGEDTNGKQKSEIGVDATYIAVMTANMTILDGLR